MGNINKAETKGLKSENQTEVLNSVKNSMNYLLHYYFIEGLEEYVEDFLKGQNLSETEGKRCKKIKLKWSDITDMLEEYLTEKVEYIDTFDIADSCTDELIEYIQSQRNDIEFEYD